MTNKLPEVGQKYRLKNYRAKIINVDSEGVTFVQGNKEYWDSFEDFFSFFEPLEDNLQNTPQSANSDKLFLEKESFNIKPKITPLSETSYLEVYSNGAFICEFPAHELHKPFSDSAIASLIKATTGREVVLIERSANSEEDNRELIEAKIDLAYCNGYQAGCNSISLIKPTSYSMESFLQIDEDLERSIEHRRITALKILKNKVNKTPNPVDLKKEEVNEKPVVKDCLITDEVEKAKKDLKDDLNAWFDDIFGEFVPIEKIRGLEPKPVLETFLKVKALLDALDKQDNIKTEAKPVADNKIEGLPWKDIKNYAMSH